MSNADEEKPAPVLDPIDRVSEVIFGLLMAVTGAVLIGAIIALGG